MPDMNRKNSDYRALRTAVIVAAIGLTMLGLAAMVHAAPAV